MMERVSSSSDSEPNEELPMLNFSDVERRRSIMAESYDPDQWNDESVIDYASFEGSQYKKTPDQIKRLLGVCKTQILFRHMDDFELNEMIRVMFQREVSAGEKIISQGERGDIFYIIEDGVFEVFVKDRNDKQELVTVYENEGHFGELALLYNCPRSATVIARNTGLVWCLNRKYFKRFVLSHSSKQRRAYLRQFKSVQLLQQLNPQEQMNLADALQKRNYEDGECIVREGEPGVEMYFILEGSVLVYRNELAKETVVTELKKGQYFGELALLSKQPRTASVNSKGKSTLAVLGVESFERLLGPCIASMKTNSERYKDSSLV